MKSFIKMLILLITVAALIVPAQAVSDLSLVCERALSSETYTLGDIAAARLSAYGILDDMYKTPQKETSTPLSSKDALSLLKNAFGEEAVQTTVDFNKDIKTQFISVLLQFLGYKNVPDGQNIVQFASEVGLDPVGTSDEFTLGDAALYLMETVQELAQRDNLSIAEIFGTEEEIQQIPFPESMQITPTSFEDADEQVKDAIKYVPTQIRVSMEQMPTEDALRFYQEYRGYEYQIESRTYTDDIWYLNAVEPRFPMRVFLTGDERSSSDSIYMKKIDTLNQRLYAGSIDDDTYDYEQDILTAEYCGIGPYVDLNPSYNEAWILACDSDEVFYAYQDSTLSSLAEAFFNETIAPLDSPTDYEIVMAAKKAVIANAVYDKPVGRDENGVFYSNDAYSLEGFFEDGNVVCAGYSSIFQYLMTRAGIPCIEVLGATRSSKDAAAGKTDHAWNKVQIDGSWYNIDTCWADTSGSTRYDLKSDKSYEQMRHWGVYNWGGSYTANADISAANNQ